MKEIKRVIFSLFIAAIFMSAMGLFSLPPALQLLSFKAVLVSLAFTHAHIVGKLAFPQVNWDESMIRPVHYVRVLLYVVFIYAYSLGG